MKEINNWKVDFVRNSYIRFYKAHKKEILKALDGCFQKGSLIAESEVDKFEKNFAKFCNRKYCITTASGTDALILTSVISPFKALSPYRYKLPEEIFNKESKCGLITYMNSVVSDAPQCDILVEDACQAVGRKLVGDISCFSFYPAKMIGGMGKGGALVTNNEEYYRRLKEIRDDKWHNIWLDEINASFLNVKLKYLPKLLKQRQKVADYYNKYLPQEIIFNKKCLQNYLVIVPDHDEFIKFMRKNGVEVISDKSDFYEGNLENAIRLPIYAEMKLSEIKYVVDTIKKYYE